jgi:hypothetical protein
MTMKLRDEFITHGNPGGWKMVLHYYSEDEIRNVPNVAMLLCSEVTLMGKIINRSASIEQAR